MGFNLTYTINGDGANQTPKNEQRKAYMLFC